MSELDIVERHMKVGIIDPFAILSDLGVRTDVKAMAAGVTGCIARPRRHEWTVTINSALSGQRRRFAAAHELAHYLLHRDLIPVGDRHEDRLFTPGHKSEIGGLGPFEEGAANRYACQILMPADMIRKAWASIETAGQDARVREMVGIFGLNVEAMTIRLRTLGLVGYMLWVKGIVALQPNPTLEDVERNACRWYTINEAGNRSGPCRYDTVEEAVRDGKARMHSGRTGYAVTEYDLTRETWDVFDRPADAIDTETGALDRAA